MPLMKTSNMGLAPHAQTTAEIGGILAVAAIVIVNAILAWAVTS